MIRRGIRKYLSSFEGLPKDIWLLSLIMFLNRMGTMVLFFLSLYLIEFHGFSEDLVSYALVSYGAGSILGSYYGGLLTTRFGAINIQVWGLILSGISLVIMGQMDTLVMISVLAFITAATSDIIRPANITMVAEICPDENNTRAFSLNRLAINLGMAIGPAIGGYLAVINYRLLFWVDGLTCITAGLIFMYIFRGRGYERPEEDKKIIKKSPWRDVIFLILMVAMFLFAISFFQLFGTWPVYLKKSLLFAEPAIGLFLTINALLVVLIEMPIVQWLEDKNYTHVIIVGAIFTFAGFFLLPFGTSFAFVLFTVILWSIGEVLVFPFSTTYISKRTNANNRGKYFGIYTLAYSVALVIAPLYGFGVVEKFGENMIWYLMLPVLIITISLLLYNKSLLRKEAN